MVTNKEVDRFIEQIHAKQLPITDAQALAFGLFCTQAHGESYIRKSPKGFLSRLATACQFVSGDDFSAGLQEIVRQVKLQLNDQPYIALTDAPLGAMKENDEIDTDYPHSGGRSSVWVYQQLLDRGLPKPDLVINKYHQYTNPDILNDPRVSALPIYFFDDWAFTGNQVEEAVEALKGKGTIDVFLVRSTASAKNWIQGRKGVKNVYAVAPELLRMDEFLTTTDIRYLHRLFWCSEGKRLTPSSWPEVATMTLAWSPYKIPDSVSEVFLGTRRLLQTGELIPTLINEVTPPYAPQNGVNRG